MKAQPLMHGGICSNCSLECADMSALLKRRHVAALQKLEMFVHFSTAWHL
jgi:hypothetical protein